MSNTDLNYNTKNNDKYKEMGGISKNIDIDIVELTESKGNIRNLQKQWSLNEVLSKNSCETFKKKSLGKTSINALIEVPNDVYNLAKELDLFIENTCVFLESIGVKFQSADEKASGEIKRK